MQKWFHSWKKQSLVWGKCLVYHHFPPSIIIIHLSVCSCIRFCISICLLVRLPDCLFIVCVSVYLFLSICLLVWLSAYLFIYLPLYFFVYLSMCLSIYLSIHLSINISLHNSTSMLTYLSIYLPSYLFSYLSIWLSIYLLTYLSAYLSICSPIYLLIYLSIYLIIYLSTVPTITPWQQPNSTFAPLTIHAHTTQAHPSPAPNIRTKTRPVTTHSFSMATVRASYPPLQPSPSSRIACWCVSSFDVGRTEAWATSVLLSLDSDSFLVYTFI